MVFRQIAQDGQARAGVLEFPNGTQVSTPAFMPVGTVGSVKGMDPGRVWDMGYRLILGNTYHLHLRPTSELVFRRGGLQKFIGWPGAMLTDSGGYQAFSLSSAKVDDQGVAFRSHIDGSRHYFTPEKSLEIQRNLGSDIAMVLDHCLPHGKGHSETLNAMERTHRWAYQSLQVKLQPHQSLFGIAQGGFFADLRERSIKTLAEMEFQGRRFDGIALGGLAVGEPQEVLHRSLAEYSGWMPADRPRYVMGIGYPKDILIAIEQGIDMMDCVLPTRNARNGQAFTSLGPLSIKQQKYKEDDAPLDPNCLCSTCQTYSRSYQRHLYQAGEMLAPILLTHHNLYFYHQVATEAREAIIQNRYAAFKKEFLERLDSGALE